MGKLNIRSIRLGGMGTNCYILTNTETKEALIVDPEDRGFRVKSYLDEKGLTPKAILLTHGHYDHIGGAEEVKQLTGVPIYAGAKEQETLGRAEKNLSTLFGRPMVMNADYYAADGEVLNLAGFSVEVLFTPGHTEGSVCYYIPEEKVLLSGDTLFYASVGRTDFPGGSSRELLNSLRTRVFKLPEDTDVYPGHEQATTIGFEKKYNPYA